MGTGASQKGNYLDGIEVSSDQSTKYRRQQKIDKPLTFGRDDDLLSIRHAHGVAFRYQAAAFLGSVVFRQFQGRRSSSLWTGCSAMRASTSASHT
jgi:hypothetical protein